MALEILCLKTATGSPSDGIDNFIRAVFGKMSPDQLSFFLKAPPEFKESGAIRRLASTKLGFLFRKRPRILWGFGHPRELVYAILRPFGIRYIINFHSVLFAHHGPWAVRTPWFLRRMLFSRADLIVCPSEFSASSVRRYFPDKRVVAILNGVDTRLFNPQRKNQNYLQKKFGVRFEKPLVVFVGALQPRKRPDLMLRVAQRCSGANFILVGRDFSPWRFGENAAALPNAQWVPQMSREDIAALFASSDAFMFPSVNEPSAAVIGEAMASGLPVVASASGGNAEFIRDGDDGFLVSVDGEEEGAFATRIKELIAARELGRRVGIRARARAESFLSWERAIGAYQEVIRSYAEK